MEEITLQQLLEAGCHFGHKAERWHPKAQPFIFTEKDGIHIIDLAKTKAGLGKAMAFVKDTATRGEEVLLVGTKRQAAGIIKQEAQAAGAPYLSERWIGGFLTNWDQVHKNIDKINRLDEEQKTGAWKKYPKHEQSKLARYLARIKVYYAGVLKLNTLPAALFIVDVKKEYAVVREAMRRGVPVVAMVDTNSNPTGVDYVIPANDDAVGSIQCITHAIAMAYQEGKELREKQEQAKVTKAQEEGKKKEEVVESNEKAEEPVKKNPDSTKATPGKRGRPKKT